jgi:hypothetical protein
MDQLLDAMRPEGASRVDADGRSRRRAEREQAGRE